MKLVKKILKPLGLLLMACLFAICMVLGVVPIIPKRKESFAVEIHMEAAEELPGNTVALMQDAADPSGYTSRLPVKE